MFDQLVLFGLPTSWFELVCFVLSVITVVLNIRQNHWAWLFSILSSAAYAVVFFQSKIYGDMALQYVFVAVSLWGWYQWRHGGEQHGVLNVSRLSARGYGWGGLAWLVLFGACTIVLKQTDTDVPYIDAFLTAGSLVGQVLLSKKKIENWHVWIGVDVIYVGLYIHKGLFLTALLYAVFVALAVAGLREWYQSEGRQDASLQRA